MKFTVFGGSGFIGSNLVTFLKKKGYDVFVPPRDATDFFDDNLGHVVYAIGLTGDYRTRPFDTVEAHVGLLSHLLQNAKFDSWLYLSSTRVYRGIDNGCTGRESLPVSVYPGSDGLYDISKLLGESLCLSCNTPKTRIVRLSNVYGFGQGGHTFLASIIEELNKHQKVIIHESLDSGKDYVSLVDVLPILEAIALSGRERIYNLAGGEVVTHSDLAQMIIQLTGYSVDFENGAPRRSFAPIDITRIVKEFDYQPTKLADNLRALLNAYEIF